MGDLSAMLKRLRITMNKFHDNGDFKKVRTLGSGAFGCVDLCTVEVEKTYAKKGDQVAVKRFFSISKREMAKKEIMILMKLKHEFIVAFLDHFKDSMGRLAIVMEFCDEGTLEDFLTACPFKPYPEFCVWRLVWQFSTALSFLHGQHPPIRHNDLKPANILCRSEPGVDGFVNIKIADFGVCNVLGKIMEHTWLVRYFVFHIFFSLGETPSAMYYHAGPGGGTVCYMAPEVLRGDDPHITTSADMWSLGAVLSFIANDREHLFKREWDVFKWKGEKSPMKRQFKYPKLHTLVLSLLSLNKHRRPSAEDLLKEGRNHPERRDRDRNY